MKRFVFLLSMALIWGCQDRATGPTGPGAIDNAGVYGSSVVKLPALNGLAKAAQGVAWKFMITITGPGMDQMTFSYALNGRDTAIFINKIPAGPARLFTGVLYGSNGARYEGTAIAEIVAGQTAYVTLYLRQTGSAQIDVIIEGVNDGGAAGCYDLKGTIDTLTLDGFSFKILEPSGGSQMWSYVYQYGEMVGKFWGAFDSRNYFSGEIAIPGIFNGVAMVKGTFNTGYNAFKCEVFSMVDTTSRIGILYGNSTPCDTVMPPPVPPVSDCFRLGGNIDTLRLDNFTMKIVERSDSLLLGYFYRGAEMVGKLYGELWYSSSGTDPRLTGTIVMPGLVEEVRFDGIITSDFAAFKGSVYSMVDTLSRPIGTMYGNGIPCDTVLPPSYTCWTDTVGSSTSCNSIDSLIRFAQSTCEGSGLKLNTVSLLEPCHNGPDSTFSYICFECCGILNK